MNLNELLKILRVYKCEIESMLPRFTKSSDGLLINSDDENRFTTLVGEVRNLIQDHIPAAGDTYRIITRLYEDGKGGFCQTSSKKSLELVQGQIESLCLRIERNPRLIQEPQELAKEETKNFIHQGLEIITNRFHSVVIQIKKRYNNRETLNINDEYDVQNLFHALLQLYFSDIRPEEWNPSYAGSSKRSDFLLPEIETIIEIKKTRNGLNAKKLGDELLIDIAHYKNHSQCKKLICFVYDPEQRIANPRGFESDLTSCDRDINVRTFIVPRFE